MKRFLLRHRNILTAAAGALALLALAPVSGAHNLLASVTQTVTIEPQKVTPNEQPPAVFFYEIETQGENLLEVVLAEIEAAMQSIDMVMYSYEHPLVHQALNAATDRGVHVRVLTDSKALEKTRSRLTDAKYVISAPRDTKEGHMHHKYLVVDDAVALVGSLNLTQLQVKHDPSVLFRSTSQSWIETLNEETSRLMRNRSGRSKFKSHSYAPFAAQSQSASATTNLWLSPGVKRNSVKEELIEMIESATQSIDIVLWQWTDRDIARAVAAKAEEGVAVRIIADDRYLWDETAAVPYLWNRLSPEARDRMQVISDFGATLSYRAQNPHEPYFNPYIHEHTLIVDQTAVATGTANWTFRGFFRNDEMMIVSTESDFVRAFSDQFSARFATMTASHATGEKVLQYALIPNTEAYAEPCNEACPADLPVQIVTFQADEIVKQKTILPK